MSRSFSTTGYVTSRRNFSEADRMLTIYSKEMGKISVVARGVRKPTAKLSSRLEPFFETRFDLVQSHRLPIITGATPLQALQPVGGDYDALILSQATLELTELSHTEELPSEEWYALLTSALQSYATPSSAENPSTLAWAACLMYSVNHLGFAPTLPESPEPQVLHIADGVFAERGSGPRLSTAALKLWRYLHATPQQWARVRGAEEATRELTPVLEAFWEYHSGMALRSRALAK